jgi:hypothetical protein
VGKEHSCALCLVISALLLQGFRRVKRLDKFEKDLRR